MDTTPLIRELGQLLGLPGLALDGRGCCGLRLPAGPQVDLHLLAPDDTLGLTTEVGIALTSELALVADSLLMANLALARPGRGAVFFSLDRPTGMVLGHLSVPLAGLEAAALLARIKALAGMAGELRLQLVHRQWLAN